VGLDFRLQISDLLLGGGDGIGAGDETARRSFLVRDRDQRPRELRRVPDWCPFWAFQYSTSGPLRSP